MKLLTYLLAGVLFSVGLVISGMTQPSKVVGFLDFFGVWDPSLAFVMVGAILVHLVSYRLIVRRPSPLMAPKFLIPTRRDVDRPLVVGSALFGIGWGLGGYCPGPAITSLVTFEPRTVAFVLSMLGGMLFYGRLTRQSTAKQEPISSAQGAPQAT